MKMPFGILSLTPVLVLALPLLSQRDLVDLFGNEPTTLARSLLDEPVLTVAKSTITTHTINHGSTTSGLSSPTSTILLPSSTITAESIPASTSNLAVPSPTSYLPEAPPTSPEETTQWKVIGIGIITVGLIATAILSIVFFDSWWNFFCDLCGCGKRRKQGQECMVPDWEKRDWELKLAHEDGHRYPTLPSLHQGTSKKDPAEY